MTLLATTLGAGSANASTQGAEFVSQAREAGLSAGKARALQAKVDGYLAKLDGRGTQISPNQIDLNGAVLNVAVPGEDRPRQLAVATRAGYQADACDNYHYPYEWFCAFQYQGYEGDAIGMWNCAYYYMPWATVGSWTNNQTRGTQPTAYFTNGSSWRMPAAPSWEAAGVDWRPVVGIRNC